MSGKNASSFDDIDLNLTKTTAIFLENTLYCWASHASEWIDAHVVDLEVVYRATDEECPIGIDMSFTPTNDDVNVWNSTTEGNVHWTVQFFPDRLGKNGLQMNEFTNVILPGQVDPLPYVYNDIHICSDANCAFLDDENDIFLENLLLPLEDLTASFIQSMKIETPGSYGILSHIVLPGHNTTFRYDFFKLKTLHINASVLENNASMEGLDSTDVIPLQISESFSVSWFLIVVPLVAIVFLIFAILYCCWKCNCCPCIDIKSRGGAFDDDLSFSSCSRNTTRPRTPYVVPPNSPVRSRPRTPYVVPPNSPVLLTPRTFMKNAQIPPEAFYRSASQDTLSSIRVFDDFSETSSPVSVSDAMSHSTASSLTRMSLNDKLFPPTQEYSITLTQDSELPSEVDSYTSSTGDRDRMLNDTRGSWH